MTEITHIPEPSNATAAPLPVADDPPASPAATPLILFGSNGDELVCVDDTCVPPGAAE
jgi:hypothetical protein